MCKILIIDDETSVRSMLKIYLEQHGYEVYLAENGKQGVDCYDQFEPDIVITDIFMPDQDGFETIMELKQRNTNVPIIAITGGYNLDLDYLGIAKKFGASKTFFKPFDLTKLLVAVEELRQ